MTAAELERLPRGSQRHELVRGELRTLPPTGYEHGRITSRFDRSLGNHVAAQELGEVVTGEPGFLLTEAPDTVRAPDVAFLRRERVAAAGRVRDYWRGAPDLVVEVVSPHDLYTEVEEKIAEWLAHGTRLVFVVNPQRRTVAVHRPGEPVHLLSGEAVLTAEDVVPGWQLPLSELFGPE